MNNKGKNKDLLPLVDVKNGLGIVELGKLASLALITDQAAHFSVVDGNVVSVPSKFFVDLTKIDEELAIKVCVLLGYKDADIITLLESREATLD